ncbi:MAG TPA: hypothetical protein VMG82_26370 [Candidatus Sulfotelmatobacter sp.]|nr:hypothetical protein [Candidatus Sulfotelmatobacter sp.]
MGDTDPQGGVEQETDQLILEPFEVVAANGTGCPGVAVAEVGVMFTVTGVELLLQPNSQRARAAQSSIRTSKQGCNFTKHPISPKAAICLKRRGC